MNNDTLFQIANTCALLGWLPLILVPRWKYTLLTSRTFVILPLSILYTIIIFSGISNFDPSAFSTLTGVKELFANDQALIAGWIHYLAFDLFVGTYIVQKGITTETPRWMYTICLPFTFMFGPLGILIFGLMLLARRQNF